MTERIRVKISNAAVCILSADDQALLRAMDPSLDYVGSRSGAWISGTPEALRKFASHAAFYTGGGGDWHPSSGKAAACVVRDIEKALSK